MVQKLKERFCVQVMHKIGAVEEMKPWNLVIIVG